MPTHTRLAQICAQETTTAHEAGAKAVSERWCCTCAVKMVAGRCPQCGCFAADASFDLPSAICHLQSLQDRVATWQRRNFPDQPLDGKLAHLCREAAELRANPRDLFEWADVLILLLGSAAMEGLTVERLVAVAEEKFAIVQNRQWGPADSEGVHHHLG